MLSWMRERVWPVLKQTAKAWSEDDGFLLSAAMAYYAAFALFPLCLVLIAGLGMFMRFSAQAEPARERLLSLLAQNTTPWLADQLKHILAGVETSAAVGGPLGLAALVFAAIGIFLQFEKIFDRLWGVQQRKQAGVLRAIKRAVIDRATAFLMLLGVGGLLVILFLADMVLTGVRPYVVQLPAGNNAWQAIQLLVSLVLNALLFGTLYKTLPKEHTPWRAAFAGGALVAIIWEAGQQVLAPLVIGEKYTAYGVVGSFIAVMIWLYYASAVVFLGAEFVQVLSGAKRPGDPSTAELL